MEYDHRPVVPVRASWETIIISYMYDWTYKYIYIYMGKLYIILLLTMIPVRENSEVVIIYPYIYMDIYEYLTIVSVFSYELPSLRNLIKQSLHIILALTGATSRGLTASRSACTAPNLPRLSRGRTWRCCGRMGRL